MSTLWNQTALAMFASCVAFTLMFAGCEVNEKDVADARDKIVPEQQDTAEARLQGERNIQQAEKELADARHEAMRVPYEGGKNDQVLEKERELAEAKQRRTHVQKNRLPSRQQQPWKPRFRASNRSPNDRTTRVSFGENQFALFRSSQTINLTVVFDPDFITTARQRFEADNLWQPS